MTKLMKVEQDTKDRLEILKTTYGVGSLSAVVDKLIDENMRLAKEIEAMEVKKEEYASLISTNFIEVGSQNKELLNNISKDYSLQNWGQAIDLLLDVYYSTPAIDRSIFDKWMLRKSV